MRIKLTILLLLFSAVLKAPEAGNIFVFPDVPFKPYKLITEAVGYVESKYDTLVINEREQAYGYFQVRQIRLDDYYLETGVKYSLDDMLDYYKAEKVFLYYATKYRHDDYKSIAYEWNRSKTDKYWSKIEKFLYKNQRKV